MSKERAMKELSGNTAFITGGGSGVGLGQAKAFAAAGMNIAIADIREHHLDAAMTYFGELGARVHAICLDITDRTAFAKAADEAERILGPVRLLCNTAGVSQCPRSLPFPARASIIEPGLDPVALGEKVVAGVLQERRS
jgi:NADP-dependent 3-hydroxy acid dehydrogenase YdfG